MKKKFVLKDVQITPITRQRIEKKIDKLQRLSEQISNTDFLLDKSSNRFTAEVKVKLKRKTLMAKKESYSIGDAIDDVFKKIKREISDYKGKARNK